MEENTHKTSQSKRRLPEPGFSRLAEILGRIPVSKSAWYAAIGKGRIRPPTKLGERTAAYDNVYINGLLDRLEAGERIL